MSCSGNCFALAQRRHPRKGMKWIVRRYWVKRPERAWNFASPKEHSWLRHHTDTFHLNHYKVRSDGVTV